MSGLWSGVLDPAEGAATWGGLEHQAEDDCCQWFLEGNHISVEQGDPIASFTGTTGSAGQTWCSKHMLQFKAAVVTQTSPNAPCESMVHYVADAAHDHALQHIACMYAVPWSASPYPSLWLELKALSQWSSEHACLERGDSSCTYLIPCLLSMHSDDYFFILQHLCKPGCTIAGLLDTVTTPILSMLCSLLQPA